MSKTSRIRKGLSTTTLSNSARDPEAPVGAWEPLGSLDKLLEHRARLGICVLLTRNDRVSFRRLRELLEETDGNLGAHLRKLESAGYVRVDKEFVARKPVSWYRISPAGRKALASHLEGLSAMIREAKGD